MSQPNISTGGLMRTGRIVIFLAAVCMAVLIGYKYYQTSDTRIFDADYTTKPKEMQINYIPSDFSFDMDEDDLMAIVTNPQRYRREFNDMVYDLNLSLLGHVANRMDLPDSIRVDLETEYRKHHPYLKQLYYNDFIQLQDTTSGIYRSWYNKEFTTAIDVLNEVASKYTCFLINQVIITLLEANGGKYMAKGKSINTPCGIAMTEGLRPLITRLQEKAAIDDFTNSKDFMEKYVEEAIAELATMEVRDKKALNRQMKTKVLGINVSSTDVEISAISILKVGFDLKQFFQMDLDSKRKTVVVTLPPPTVLSHEVYPKVDKLDIGWLREIQNVDFNSNFEILQREFRNDAYANNVMEKAKVQAENVMEMLLTPTVDALGGYTLKIQFQRGGTSTLSELEAENLEQSDGDSPLAPLRDNQIPFEN